MDRPYSDLALAALDVTSSLKLISQELGVIASNLTRLMTYLDAQARLACESGEGASPELIAAARRELAGRAAAERQDITRWPLPPGDLAGRAQK